MKVTRCNNGEKCDDCNLAADIIINTYAQTTLTFCFLCWMNLAKKVRLLEIKDRTIRRK